MFFTYFNRSFIFTFFILLIFIFKADIELNILTIFYLLTIPLYYYYILLILSIPFFIPIIFLKQNYLLILLAIFPKVLFDFLLIINLIVFNVYQFHIDLMFINMFLYDFSGLGISYIYIIIVLLIFLIIFIINFFLLKYTKKKTTILFFLIPLILFIVNQLIHVYGDFFKKNSIIKYSPYLPYYLPLTSSKYMSKYFKKVNNQNSIFIKNSGIFKYPLKEISFKKNSPQPNILFFILESWRYDMLTEDITPNIFKFSKKASMFNDHYSGGSVTVSGLFSLMYGLFPSYMNFAKASPYKFQTIFTKSLKKEGYDIEVYTPSNFNRFSLKEMLFGNINNNKFNDKGDDKDMANLFSIKNSKKPWFKFIFLTSSHYDYHYPKKWEKFKPIPKFTDNFFINRDINSTPFINKYKNSLLYLDSLFQKIISKIDTNNTIIVITSDHGEEFNENKKGFWTHGNNFTKYQIKVPLILKLPKQKKGKQINHRTSHMDIVPTILEQLGVNNKISDYSSGENLFNSKERFLLIQSYKDKAYFIKNSIYSTGVKFQSYDVNNINIKNNHFYTKEIKKIRDKERLFLD